MRFLSKIHFRWKEPKAFTRLHDEFERTGHNRWSKPMWTVIGAAGLMGSWYLAGLNPQKQLPTFGQALPLAIAGGLFYVYALPWLMSLFPSEVRFYKSYIMRNRGNTLRTIKYKDLESFSWQTNEEFSVLILREHKSRKEILLGVPTEISPDAVSQFLADHTSGSTGGHESAFFDA